tara:strand:- start:5898 stop:8471 length:2574 start_codon:yes stop_codon:yes gene_type:complete
MAKFNDKISTIINSQLPEFVVADHPKFADFLKVYYQLLESSELGVTSIQATDGLLIETETGQINNIVLNSSGIGSTRTLLDTDDKILLEDTPYGKFTRGEVIKGQTSNATASVFAEDLNNNRLFITSQNNFVKDEVVVGQTSNAYAIVNTNRPSPVNNIMDLLKFRDPDGAITNYLNSFRDEFLTTLPENLDVGVNKRNVIKNIRSMYRAKGTTKGHETFFRLLFNSNSETIYPRENILRVSDGQWDSKKVLRCKVTVGKGNDLIGRQITGFTSGAVATIENLAIFQIGQNTVTEFTINADSIVGTFLIGEEIQGTASDTDDYFIKATVTGIPGNKNITNDGSLNDTSDSISVIGGGSGGLFQVEEIGPGKIEEVIIDNPGRDYRVGDSITIDDTGTSGLGAAGFVSNVNGDVIAEDGETLVYEDETTRGDTYAGNSVMQETGTDIGQISKCYITNPGNGYLKLPTAVVNGSTGLNGSVKLYGSDIGRIVKIKTVELGLDYQLAPSPPTLTFYNNIVGVNISGSFLANETITGGTSGASGKLAEYDNDRGLIRLQDVTGTFQINETLTSPSGGQLTIKKIDTSSATIDVVSVADTDGRFLNEDGEISETTVKVQDSLYYQDFSYVLKVGRSINEWRDSFKKTMHTSGFYFTGEVQLSTRLNAQISTPITGAVSGAVDDPFFSIANILFSTIFGRRLGTVDDGTSLRNNAYIAGSIDNDNSTERFSANTRDVTLHRQGVHLTIRSSKRENINGVQVSQGWAYAGPRYGSINTYANRIFGAGVQGAGNTFKTLSELKVFGTKTTLDGLDAVMLMTSDEQGKQVKMNFAFPSVTAFSGDSFDNTVTKFDKTTRTFDDTTV